jgi:hypothetical protein
MKIGKFVTRFLPDFLDPLRPFTLPRHRPFRLRIQRIVPSFHFPLSWQGSRRSTPKLCRIPDLFESRYPSSLVFSQGPCQLSTRIILSPRLCTLRACQLYVVCCSLAPSKLYIDVRPPAFSLYRLHHRLSQLCLCLVPAFSCLHRSFAPLTLSCFTWSVQRQRGRAD